jgi:hypothetical protein
MWNTSQEVLHIFTTSPLFLKEYENPPKESDRAEGMLLIGDDWKILPPEN